MFKTDSVRFSIDALVKADILKVSADTTSEMFDRIKNIELSTDEVQKLQPMTDYVGVTEEFVKVIQTFKTPEGITPAGFRHELVYGGDRSLRIDLKRDIAFMENSVRRPTNLLFSANTADPAEVSTMKNLIANLTTNPAIIYSNFLNNPKANVNNRYKDRFEVLAVLRDMVGSGVDISVELNNPFASREEIYEEIAKFEEVLPKYQLVVKVPHTGPLNADNIDDFLSGKYGVYDKGESKDFFYGHNLAYELQEKGYRVNFTLMAEPHQTALALQAKPYFINAFVQRRTDQTKKMTEILSKLDSTRDKVYMDELHDFMLRADMLAFDDEDEEKALEKARTLVAYRTEDPENDGLDSVRHSLRVLKGANLPDTRLIVCNMKTPKMYYDLDKLVTEEEFADMKQKVVVTCEPDYFSQFTSSPTIYCYQRSFLSSVK